MKRSESGAPGTLGASLACLAWVLTACGGPTPEAPAERPRFQLNLTDYHLSTDAFQTKAHQVHLPDPMAFEPVPDQGILEGKTAVVGSDVCRFYPNAHLATAEDLTSLGEGVPVPFGTILPITGSETRSDDTQHQGLFSFQENWNWFYPTTYHGQDGLVFGADLYGLEDTNADNRISSLLYTSEGAPAAFHPILGYQYLPPDVKERVATDRIAIQSVDPKEYYLGYAEPDDFIALYRNHESNDYSRGKWNRKVPMFITTDLAAHALHLVFDREFQHVEQTVFEPRLKNLVDRLIAALDQRQAVSEPHRLAIARARLYLQTASALLALAPVPNEVEDKYQRSELSWSAVDADAVLATYPASVRTEVSQINAHQGLQPSAVFDFGSQAVFQEDYSQYAPRGHYTKNGVLSAYFQAMMWFGRIPFLIASDGLTDDNRELTRALVPVALVLVETLDANPELAEQWASLFDPIGSLIGPSDDLSYRDLAPWWKRQGVTDFDAWVADPGNIDALVLRAHQELRAPEISGSSVWQQPSEGPQRKPPLNWRLFGQRFTWDSFIHQAVSPPRLMDRDMVRGLDVMKTFGSRTADLLLKQSDYPSMPQLKPALDGLESTLGTLPPEWWQRTYYNLSLYLVRAQARFEPGSGFYFTETPAWGQKAMLAAHGTWAELRHDTLLYVKQSAAERAGDGDFLPTFRTKPIPEPVHYLEPNLPFWQGASMAVQKLATTLDSHGLLDQEAAEKLPDLITLFDRCVRIAITEGQDEPVASEDLTFLSRIPAQLVHLVLIGLEPGDLLDEEQLKMAVIADVYTNFERKQVLEVGVGRPQRLYVALNDRQGGKRIAVGYTYSYYEFAQPMDKRLGDEAWKKEAYKQPQGPVEREPFWAVGLALPPTQVKRY